MAIRGAGEWMESEGAGFLTSEGKTREDGNHTRPVWTDMHGPIGGSQTGVTVINHPANFRFPQPVRLHPSMPYFVYTPHAFRSFTIQPGKPYTARYRYHVHLGAVEPKRADRLFHDFAAPPEARRLKE